MQHYNWNLVEEEQMNPLLTRKVIHGRNVTIARIHLQKYAVVPQHSHPNEQISMVERGLVRFVIAGEEKVLGPGDVLAIPPDVPHLVEALEDSLAVDLFAPPREDWIRGDDAYLRNAPDR